MKNLIPTLHSFLLSRKSKHELRTNLANLFAYLLIISLVLSGMSFSVNAMGNEAPPVDPDDLDNILYLPLVVRAPNSYRVSGQVRDAFNNPLPDTMIIDDTGRTTFTDAQGNYSFEVPEGARALAPSLNGYVFNPSVNEVEVFGNLTGQDFVALQAADDAINGGFESDGYWTFLEYGTAWQAGYDTTIVHSGMRSSRTGILEAANNAAGYSTVLGQGILIPSGASDAVLRIWLYTISEEGTADVMPAKPDFPLDGEATLAYDAQFLQVLDESGAILDTPLWVRRDDRMWTYHEFNLSAYAGTTIQLHFGTYNDGADGVTAMFIDDLSLETSYADPQQCTNYLVNSDFEGTGGWVMPATSYQAGYSTRNAFSGIYSMRTGIPLHTTRNIYSYSDAYQVVTIPSGAVSATLSMQLLPQSEEAIADLAPQAFEPPAVGTVWGLEPLAYDAQYVLILNPYTGAIRERLLWWQPPHNRLTWTYRAFDLSRYAGQTIRIQYGSYNDGYGGRTVMWVDDVYLDVCDHATPTPTPTATPSPGVCSEQVRNGDFEAVSNWRIPITVYSAGYSSLFVHSPVQSMRTGIYYQSHNRYSYSDFRQSVYIPPAASQATLSFWAYSLSGEVYDLDPVLPDMPTSANFGTEAMAGDVQYLLVLDIYGNWIDTLVWQRRNDGYWRYYEINLRRYAGREFKLQFGTYNNGYGGVTSMFIDDVSLWVCP